MSRTYVLLALLVISSLHMSMISAFSIAPPFGISLASLVTRRGRRSIQQPSADAGGAGSTGSSPATGSPVASFIGRNPNAKLVDPTLLEFNMMCQQAIADERRQHYYPIVREISEHDARLP